MDLRMWRSIEQLTLLIIQSSQSSKLINNVRHFSFLSALILFDWQVVDTVYGELGKHDKVCVSTVYLAGEQ